MNDVIRYMLNTIGTGSFGSTLDQLVGGPESFNSSLYDLSTQIHDTAVYPVTAVVLAILFCIELTRVAQKVDEVDRQLGVKVVAATLVKLGLVFVAAQNAGLFLKAIDGVCSFVMGGMTAVASSPGSMDVANLGDQLSGQIDAAGWGGQAGLLVLLFIPFLVAQVGGVVLMVTTFAIFIQMDMLGCFASLPVALIACDETRSMGVGFFKRYAQIGFQAVCLWLLVFIYRFLMAHGQLALVASGPSNMESLIGWVVGNFGTFLFASVLLVFLVITANSVSKAIFGD